MMTYLRIKLKVYRQTLDITLGTNFHCNQQSYHSSKATSFLFRYKHQSFSLKICFDEFVHIVSVFNTCMVMIKIYM